MWLQIKCGRQQRVSFELIFNHAVVSPPQEQAAWAIVFLSASSDKLDDRIVAAGALPPLVAMLKSASPRMAELAAAVRASTVLPWKTIMVLPGMVLCTAVTDQHARECIVVHQFPGCVYALPSQLD